MKPMEIVAPAGDMACLKAAIAAQTDAVYLGLRGYGARRHATNFSLEELFEAIDYAHLRGVRLYVTLNTLMTDEEINSLYDTVKALYEYGLDGIIVQDLGWFRFLETHFPDFTIHASTQMTIGNHIEANFLKSLGFTRLVPTRELSMKELQSLQEKTDIELEIFVSGALCISYSGNCYLSSFIGGRSGNRGMCAQACRRMYRDENGNDRYALSPKDQLMGTEELEQFSQMGIKALKIEGRMKTAVYVYAMVHYFYELMQGNDPESWPEKIFNRGYSKGYMYGKKDILNTLYASNYGYPLGQLKGHRLVLSDSVMLGDGISYLDKDEQVIGGSYLNKIVIGKGGEKQKTAPAGETIELFDVPAGACYVNKTYSKELNDEIERLIKVEKKRIPVQGHLQAKVGESIRLTLKRDTHEVEVTGDILTAAQNRILTDEEVQEKIGEMGDSTFYLDNFQLDYDHQCFIPLKVLKSIKREALEKLSEKVIQGYRRKALPLKHWQPADKRADKPEIAVCVTHSWQANIAREMGIKTIYYRGLDAAREGIIDKINLHAPLASNLYQLLENRNTQVTLDWNFNITNSYSFREYSQIPKVHTIYLSPELSLDQIRLVKGDSARKGLVIYGHLTAMYIEPEIFPEDYREIANDTMDKLKVVKNTFGQTEIYLEHPMNLIPRITEILELGLDELRLDFQFESPEDMRSIIESVSSGTGTYTPYNVDRGML